MGSGSNINLQDVLSLFDGQGQGAGTGGVVPPLPARNTAFRPDPSEATSAGGLLGSVPLPERNPAFRPDPSEQPAPVGGLFGGGPGQTVVKTPPRDNNAPWREKGYAVETVPGTTTTSQSLKAQPDIVQQVANAAPAIAPAGSPRASLFGDAASSNPSSTAPVQAATNEATPAGTPLPVAKGLFASKMFAPEGGGILGSLKAKLQQTGTDPLMQIGLGLLAGGYDGTNPYPLIMQGLSGIQNQQISGVGADTAATKAQREAQDALQQQQLAAMLAQIGSKHMAQDPAGSYSIARGGAKIVK